MHNTPPPSFRNLSRSRWCSRWTSSAPTWKTTPPNTGMRSRKVRSSVASSRRCAPALGSTLSRPARVSTCLMLAMPRPCTCHTLLCTCPHAAVFLPTAHTRPCTCSHAAMYLPTRCHVPANTRPCTCQHAAIYLPTRGHVPAHTPAPVTPSCLNQGWSRG